MKRFVTAAAILVSMAICGEDAATAQNMEDLKLQVHGYATQGFLYTTQNNWDSTHSSDGSAAWTEAVVNLTVQPRPKLTIGVQTRYFLLGNFGNRITVDWAQGDYKVNDRFGFRFGKVKTPNGLLNDVQDIDPAFLWSLLPQSMYPLSSRDSILAHYGAVAYGILRINSRIGKLGYQFYAGERVLAADDGFFVPIIESGADFPNGLRGPTSGGTLRWYAPVDGLMLGVAWDREDTTGPIVLPGPGFSGNNIKSPFKIPFFFGKYEHRRYMLAGEYSRVAADHKAVFTVGPSGVHDSYIDRRQWYAMASYKVTDKLSAGAYYSSIFDLKAALGPARYQKDWTLSARYDFNQFVYAKAEQHFMDGTQSGYTMATNPGGLQPNTRLTILKVGFSF